MSFGNLIYVLEHFLPPPPLSEPPSDAECVCVRGGGGTVAHYPIILKMQKFSSFSNRSYISSEPTEISPRYFTHLMDSRKSQENMSISHFESYEHDGPGRGHSRARVSSLWGWGYHSDFIGTILLGLKIHMLK